MQKNCMSKSNSLQKANQRIGSLTCTKDYGKTRKRKQLAVDPDKQKPKTSCRNEKKLLMRFSAWNEGKTLVIVTDGYINKLSMKQAE